MSYKTILVHLNDKRRAESMLEPAIQLATRYNSHLMGLHVDAVMAAPPLSLTYASSGLGTVAAEERGNGEAIAALFTRMTATGTCVAEWQRLKVPLGDLVSVVVERGRTADLIVAGQADPDWDLSPVLDFPERLALESGRPVLVIPYVRCYPRMGRNVVIAWKAGARDHARGLRCASAAQGRGECAYPRGQRTCRREDPRRRHLDRRILSQARRQVDRTHP